MNSNNLLIMLFCLDDILVILSRDRPNNWSESIYQNFLNVFIGSFYGSCRDLVELRNLVILLDNQ